MFYGTITALITPFRDGKVDYEAYKNLINWQINSQINGLVTVGTTGEAQTLSTYELFDVIKLAIDTANFRVPVIAGTGTNNTAQTIEFSLEAKKLGINSVMIVVPYYNKPTAEGLYCHYKKIHDSIELPIIIYNAPGRSATDMPDDIIVKLSKLPNIVALKDASGKLDRIIRLKHMIDNDEFSILTGNDHESLAINGQGGSGCISVVSNIVPDLCTKLQYLWRNGDFKSAYEIHKMLAPLYDAIFCETSPSPVKYAASLLGICSAEVRLPLVSVSSKSKDLIKSCLLNLNLI